MPRPAALQDFITATEQALETRLPADAAAGQVARRIFQALRQPAAASATVSPERLPVCRHLKTALTQAAAGPGDLVPITAAFQAIEPQLAWSRRAGAAAAGEVFAQGHANALIIGQGGSLEDRDDVQIGVSLMAPEIQYVDHHHPPAEVYLVLSPGSWRQEAKPWHEPGLGGIVYNTPHILHAMKSGAAPLFAIWCLLVKDDQAPANRPAG